VITPESCAAIIYRDSGKAAEAARALRLTAGDLMGLGLIDGIISEPPEGAHTDVDKAAEFVKETICKGLKNFAHDRRGPDRRPLQQVPPHGQLLRGGLSKMNKTVVIGVFFVLGVLAFLIYSSMHIAKYRVEVCVAFQGRNECRTASADSQEHALRSAQSNACALICVRGY